MNGQERDRRDSLQVDAGGCAAAATTGARVVAGRATGAARGQALVPAPPVPPVWTELPRLPATLTPATTVKVLLFELLGIVIVPLKVPPVRPMAAVPV